MLESASEACAVVVGSAVLFLDMAYVTDADIVRNAWDAAPPGRKG